MSQQGRLILQWELWATCSNQWSLSPRPLQKERELQILMKKYYCLTWKEILIYELLLWSSGSSGVSEVQTIVCTLKFKRASVDTFVLTPILLHSKNDDRRAKNMFHSLIAVYFYLTQNSRNSRTCCIALLATYHPGGSKGIATCFLCIPRILRET